MKHYEDPRLFLSAQKHAVVSQYDSLVSNHPKHAAKQPSLRFINSHLKQKNAIQDYQSPNTMPYNYEEFYRKFSYFFALIIPEVFDVMLAICPKILNEMDEGFYRA